MNEIRSTKQRARRLGEPRVRRLRKGHTAGPPINVASDFVVPDDGATGYRIQGPQPPSSRWSIRTTFAVHSAGAWTDWTADVSVSGDDFYYDLSGLIPETTYQFRAWARNREGWVHGLPATFTTSALEGPHTTNTPVPVPFVWLETFFHGTSDYEALALADADGDGHAVWEEYVAGTDPTDPESKLMIQATTSDPGPHAIIRWMGTDQPGRLYSIYWTTNLWMPMSVLIDGVPSAYPALNVHADIVNTLDHPIFYQLGVTIAE